MVDMIYDFVPGIVIMSGWRKTHTHTQAHSQCASDREREEKRKGEMALLEWGSVKE